ncbi:MAG: phosphomannomutase/phosphoglucomutase [Firmicutes bacterium]|nr:phosphomannomutase/phosphoglucomutase [Bacillota bacterium]
MTSASDFNKIFKAYDVRGIVPEDLSIEQVFAIGAAFGKFIRQNENINKLVVGHDMRESSGPIVKALIAGAHLADCEVVDIGLVSTDLMYFASGKLSLPGVMVTASHNPAKYNGLKFCGSQARPIGQETGLEDIKVMAENILAEHKDEIEEKIASDKGGEVQDMMEDFVRHVHSFIDVEKLRPMKVVADTANGMGGLIAPEIFKGLPVDLEILYPELDGTFPNHPASPIEPENLVDLEKEVLRVQADVGLAFDGDADRVFLVDDQGVALSGSTTTAIVAKAMLEANKGATILYNCICSKAVPEIVEEMGGKSVRTRVGHSFIKAEMARTGAVFGGEHSGHYYFLNNFKADSGIIAAMVVLEVLSNSGMALSQFRLPYERYSDSGEINTKVEDVHLVIERIKTIYTDLGAEIDELDGLTVYNDSWWFNLRPSNTEPLLRLNVEANDDESLRGYVERVVAEIKEAGK